MRYVIAIVCAIPAALLATLYVSSPVATWVTNQFTYDSPDTVADLHILVFMAVNVLALAIGWAVGWMIGGRIVRSEPPV